jgi:hypothetical protein
MTMAIENHHRHFGSVSYELSPYPQFTNPWANTPGQTSSSMYTATHPMPSLAYDQTSKQQPTQPSNATMPYSTVPVTAATLNSGPGSTLSSASYGAQDLLSTSHEFLAANRVGPPSSYSGSEHSFSTAPSPTTHSYPASTTSYDSMSYPTSQPRTAYGLQPQPPTVADRRLSG